MPVDNYLINDAYVMKLPFKQIKNIGLVNTWKFGESGILGEDMEAPCPFHAPCPMHLFCLAVPELYPFIINW